MNNKYSKWMFIIFPAISMLLGWGLRGHIGGGPFGAMIPGAMVALSLCLLLKLPSAMSAVVVVFGVVGIGLGGEMTYGQTLGFLKNPETMWWGVLATTVKGSVWGMLGASVLSLGFIYNRLEKRTIIIAFLLLMFGMLIGFKLINQQMIVYFSDPSNPRSESWGALLVGAILLLAYLKYKISKDNFKIISRFATLGCIGGGLGFGLGGFWFVMGSALPKEVIFKSWWKSMEFTFGLLLGASIGYAAWRSRKELKLIAHKDHKPTANMNVLVELAITLLIGILIYWIIPQNLEPFVESANDEDGIVMRILRDIAMIMVNYSFYGFLMIMFTMYFPKLAWQIGITLTFCHAAIDLVRDNLTEIQENSPATAALIIVFLTLIVGSLTAYFQRRNHTKKSMFLLLVWSTMSISYAAFLITGRWEISNLTVIEVIGKQYFVDLVFTLAALYISWVAIKKITKNKEGIIDV